MFVLEPMPIIGRRVHELRIPDHDLTWRVIYRLDPEAVVIVNVFEKKTTQTPPHIVAVSQQRLRGYDEVIRE